MKLLIGILFLTQGIVYAGTCKRLGECVKNASEVSGIKYIYPDKMFNDKDELNTELTITKENADMVLSEVLSLYDFMKTPTKIENVWEIIPGRDIRYNSDVPTFKASKKVSPTFPNNKDPIQLIYQAQAGTEVGDIARNLRPFLSRYGRVIDMKSGIVIVQDRANVAAHVLPIIQIADIPLSKDEKLERAKGQARQHEMELARIKSGMPSGAEHGPGGKHPHQKKD